VNIPTFDRKILWKADDNTIETAISTHS